MSGIFFNTQVISAVPSALVSETFSVMLFTSPSSKSVSTVFENRILHHSHVDIVRYIAIARGYGYDHHAFIQIPSGLSP